MALGVTSGGLRVTFAGVNVTQYVDEQSISIKDTLGQGAGSGSGSKSRASSCSFLIKLGPVSKAYGAGQAPGFPALVRNGELIIYDKDNRKVFAGYATKFADKTSYTQIWTQVDCIDYWQALDRITIHESFEDGVTDTQIINDLLRKYAPWVDRRSIPTKSTFYFPFWRFRNDSLLKAIQSVVDATGFLAWVDGDKKFHYTSPNQASNAPFNLSTEPDFRSSFQFGVDSLEIDDNAVINRVYFHGGKRLSKDFTQDLSPQANSKNKVFLLAYPPRVAEDNKIHVRVNDVELVVGKEPATRDDDKLKSDGGKADVVVNVDNKTLIFNVAPGSGSDVVALYRYQLPLVTVVTDEKSRRYFGQYFDGTIKDDTVFDAQLGVQRSRVVLYEQAYGLKTLRVRCWRAGLRSGQLIHVTHSIRQLDETYLIQSVETKPLGGGVFEYALSLGAWSWDLVDVVAMVMARMAPKDEDTDQEQNTIIAQEVYEELAVSFSTSFSSKPHGGYYARATPSNDGHDAYPGFFSITS